MDAMEGVLVEQLEDALGVVEVEEQGLGLDVIDLADEED